MISTELLAVIQAYQAAFRAPSFSGSRLSLEIGNLNSWFIGATITPDGRNITISRDGDFFDTEGYSVVPELVAALKRGMNGCGIIPPNEAYTVEVDQQTHEIKYQLDTEEHAAKYTEFLLALQSLLKEQDRERKRRKPENENPMSR